jgi:SagB-type dehydrogenase family enzyme
MIKTLCKPKTTGFVSVEEAISKRRSIRTFKKIVLSEANISQILWAAQGITDSNMKFRSAPSAGATYPLDTYLFTSEGVYLYLPEEHAIKKLSVEDKRAKLSKAALNQSFIADAPLVILFVSVPERITKRYGTRGEQYINIEAGHATQNIHLQAVALGLHSVPIGAFIDEQVAEIINLPHGYKPLYIIPVGM